MSSKRDSTTRLDIGLKGLNSVFEKECETIAGEAAHEIKKCVVLDNSRLL